MKIFSLLIALLILTGCAATSLSTYVQQQPTKKPITVSVRFGSSFSLLPGSPQKWRNYAGEVVARELAKHSATVDSSATITLELNMALTSTSRDVIFFFSRSYYCTAFITLHEAQNQIGAVESGARKNIGARILESAGAGIAIAAPEAGIGVAGAGFIIDLITGFTPDESYWKAAMDVAISKGIQSIYQ